MGLIEGWDPIKIGIDPEIAEFGGLLLTWHGVFTAIGIALGVWVAVKMAARVGFIEDEAYTIALVVVPAGIIGARALFVIENWDLFSDEPLDIFRINEGGISIYGALIGGALGGLAYVVWRRMPIRAALDAAAFGGILGQGIGRIGDVINGEHFANTSDLPFAVVYTHANSPSFARDPQHLAVGYEFVGDLLIFGLLFLLWRFYKRDGLVFFSYAFLYSIMRLGVSAIRLDDDVLWQFNMAQVVALVVIGISILGFAYVLRQPTGRRAAEVAATSSPPVSEPPARR
jgi:phosphatidylglycerol:prolipoprotein diacylglycerol transferase